MQLSLLASSSGLDLWPVKQIREIHPPVLHLEAEVHIKGRRMLGMEPWARDALWWDKEGHMVWLVEMRKIRLGSTPVPSRKGGKQKEKYPGSGVYLTSRGDFKDFCVRAHTLEFIRHGWAERWKPPGTDRHFMEQCWREGSGLLFPRAGLKSGVILLEGLHKDLYPCDFQIWLLSQGKIKNFPDTVDKVGNANSFLEALPEWIICLLF